MQGRRAAIYQAAALAAGLFAAAGAAVADPLGDRIAETLCYPPSAVTMPVTGTERDALLSPPPVAGDYRDIQGSEARAWFEILPDGTAQCRTPANSAMTLFFCASVTLDDGRVLKRGTRRLCR